MVNEASRFGYYRDPLQLQLCNPDYHVASLPEELGLVNVTMAQVSNLRHPAPYLARKESEDVCPLVSSGASEHS